MKREHPYPQPYPRLLNDHNGTMRNMKECLFALQITLFVIEKVIKSARYEKKRKKEGRISSYTCLFLFPSRNSFPSI